MLEMGHWVCYAACPLCGVLCEGLSQSVGFWAQRLACGASNWVVRLGPLRGSA